MLVVIGIMLVMGALAIPAFQSLSPAQKLTIGGSRLGGIADSARMNAMSQQAPTALVVITNLPNTTDVSYRVFAALQQERTNSTYYWRQVSKWEVLPTGVVMNPDPSLLFFIPANTAANLPDNTNTFRYKNVNLATNNYGYVAFERNGSLQHAATNSTNAPRVELITGVSTDSAVQRTGPTNNWYQLIFSDATGRSKSVRP